MNSALKTVKIDGHETGTFTIILVEQISLNTVLPYPASITSLKSQEAGFVSGVSRSTFRFIKFLQFLVLSVFKIM